MREEIKLSEIFEVKKAAEIGYAVYKPLSAEKKVFGKEKSSMYMLIYADTGRIKGTGAPDLPQGCGIILAPETEALFEARAERLTYTVTAEFFCESEKTEKLTDRVFAFSDEDIRNLTRLIEASRGNDETDSQLVKIYFELILISLYKNDGKIQPQPLVKRYSDEEIVDKVKQFLAENADKKITFAQVVKSVNASATAVKTAFSRCERMGVMAYFAELKIEKAKQYIREGEYNFTQIAQLLAIDSPHRFTKLFKAKAGMTPTEYLRKCENNE